MNAVSHPAAMLAALAAAGGQLVQASRRVSPAESLASFASFLPVKPAAHRGTPQCFGPIQYRPRKTQGVFLRRLPNLPR